MLRNMMRKHIKVKKAITHNLTDGFMQEQYRSSSLTHDSLDSQIKTCTLPLSSDIYAVVWRQGQIPWNTVFLRHVIQMMCHVILEILMTFGLRLERVLARLVTKLEINTFDSKIFFILFSQTQSSTSDCKFQVNRLKRTESKVCFFQR